MKKVISLLIAAILALSCSFSAMALSDNSMVGGSSVDQAPKVNSIKFLKLPTKMQYVLGSEAGWDMSGVKSEKDIINAPFFINVKLDGAVIEAQYSDGTTKTVDVKECKTSVADPVSITEINSEEDIVKILRQFTINVEYCGAKTTFKVKVVSPENDDSDNNDEYELVSINNLAKTVYSKSDLIESSYYDEKIDDYVDCKALEIDTDKMSIIVKDKKTGELYTITSDNIYCDDVVVKDVNAKNQTLTVNAEAYAVDVEDESEYSKVETVKGSCHFSFKIKYNVSSSDNTSTNGSAPSSSATADTATPADNGAVQTGNPYPASILAALLVSGAAFAYFCSKKKIEK